jgi:23S rRNA pseudouridine1911/1915/1917 synthase
MTIAGPVEAQSSFLIPVTQDHNGLRLDCYLTQQFPSYSRSFFQKLIDQNNVLITQNQSCKASSRLLTGQTVHITFPKAEQAVALSQAQTDHLDVQIIHENSNFLIINKPAPLLMHMPTKQSSEVTLVDWLVRRHEEIKDVGPQHRPGIVHRLDKDTSGIVVVSRNDYALALFGALFKNRAIQKTYVAVVHGHPPKEGSINVPIGRHPSARHKMTTFSNHMGIVNYQHNNASAPSRAALTNYRVLEYFKDTSLVEVKPVTGRTHQIRVHFAAIGHSLVGDGVYGTNSAHINRQALHAQELSFKFEDSLHKFFAEPPADFKQLLATMRGS